MHWELRVRTICELVGHQQYYLQPSVIALLDAGGYVTSKNAIPATSASFERAVNEYPLQEVALSCFMLDCIESTKSDTYSNMWHVHALSSVIGSAIRSVYPEHNHRQERMMTSLSSCALATASGH